MSATTTIPEVTTDAALEARLDRMAAQLEEVTAELRAQRAQRELLAELVADASHVAGPALQLVAERLAAAEEAGWFTFAAHGMGVLERIVEAFDEDDIDALGDNVVAMLEAVREMTQPDVIALVTRTAGVVGESVDRPASTPSLLHLAGELREPEVRRGFDRLLVVLRSLGED